MPAEPMVQPLSYRRRSWFFYFLITIFFLAVPVFTFYATGYRIDFSHEERGIVGVGGIYISAEAEGVEMFINEEPVTDMRIFQRAAYIQNLPAGTHRLHVQGDNLHTWVKVLPVYPHIVTEVSAFNMPVVPQVRLITQYETKAGEAVVRVASGTPALAPEVVYQKQWLASTTIATSTLVANPEHAYLVELFGTSTATTTPSLLSRLEEGLTRFSFSSAEMSEGVTTTATTTQIERDRRLFERAGEVFVAWEGSLKAIPSYYCVNYTDATTTAKLYGAHVGAMMSTVLASSEELLELGNYVCRAEIKIDRKRQDVYLFAFFPGNPDLILMHLEDGLYVVETDDRSWQNTQMIYPGRDFTVVLDGGQIYIKDNGRFFELLTTLDD